MAIRGKTRKEAIYDAVYKSAISSVEKLAHEEYEIMLHFHDYELPIPITHFVTSVEKNATTDYPYEQANIRLAISHELGHQLFSDKFGRPTTGQWISIKRPNKIFHKQGLRNKKQPTTVEFVGYVANISFSVTAMQQNGMVVSSEFVLNCSSFIYPLQVGQYKLNAGEVKDTELTSITNLAIPSNRLVDPNFQHNEETKSFFLAGEDYDEFVDFMNEITLETRSVKSSISTLIDNLGYIRIPQTLTRPYSTERFIREVNRDLAGQAVSEALKAVSGAVFGNDVPDGTVQFVRESPQPLLHDGTDALRIGNFINVATSKKDLPPSCHLRETMPENDFKINNLSALQNTFSRGGSVWDLIRTTFQQSEMLYDLYFTWVSFDQSDLDAGYKVPDTACLHWGAIPTVIYRLKTLNPGLKTTQADYNKEISIYNDILKPQVEIPKLEYLTEAEKSKDKSLVDPIYLKADVPVDLRPNFVLAFPLSSQEIISHTFSLSDQFRINSTYVEDPLIQQTSQVTSGVFSTPVVKSDDAVRNGLRMIEVPYPFTSLDQPLTEALSERLFLIQGEGNQFYGGLINLPRPSTKELQPGTWISIFYPNRTVDAFATPNDIKRERLFYAYVKAIQITTRVNPQSGLVEEFAQITYTRGSWGNIAPILPPSQSGKLSTDVPTEEA